jgi:carbamoyltransferase
MEPFRVFHPAVALAPVDTSATLRGRTGTADADALIVGVSGASQNAAVAAVVGGRLVGCCEQERVTRVRAEGLRQGALPTEVLRVVLDTVQRDPTEIRAYVTAEVDATLPSSLPHTGIDHHFAHAATACLTSPFASAAVLVCDEHGDPPVSVWAFDAGTLVNVRWPWHGEAFATLYSQCARLFALGSRAEHNLEALARLGTGEGADTLKRHLSYSNGSLTVSPGWTDTVSQWLSSGAPGKPLTDAATFAASSFQRCLGDALVTLAEDVRRRLPYEHLCVGGGLFYNTYFNTRLAQSEVYSRVFVPLNPGNPGLAVGAALAVSQGDSLGARSSSPFLGPGYSMEAVKATLDNCKLSYEYLSEAEVVDAAVRALTRGLLVGWFQGRMEWGHRSLGNRSILANPFAPHVLENLNAYLKQREPYRTYGLSVCEEEAPRHFRVCAPSPGMEFEYEMCDRDAFRHVLPAAARTLRVQTLTPESGAFRDVHRAFGATTGRGVLVNTSFNGLHEPIVCTPRDAIRVFYGSGLDLLVMGQFVVRK